MIYKLSDNIFSPLGDTSEENYANIKAGLKGGALRTGVFGLPEPFFCSLRLEPCGVASGPGVGAS